MALPTPSILALLDTTPPPFASITAEILQEFRVKIREKLHIERIEKEMNKPTWQILNTVNSYIENKEFSKAFYILDRIPKQDLGRRGWFYLFIYYRESNELNKAIETIKQGCDFDITTFSYTHEMNEYLLSNGQISLAYSLSKKLLATALSNKKDGELGYWDYKTYATACNYYQNEKEKLEMENIIKSTHPQSAIDIFIEEKRYRDALDLIKTIPDENYSKKTWRLLTDIYIALNDVRNAIESIKSACAFDIENFSYSGNKWGDYLRENNDNSTALMLAKKLYDKRYMDFKNGQRKVFELWNYKPYLTALSHSGDAATIKRVYKEIIALKPDQKEILQKQTELRGYFR